MNHPTALVVNLYPDRLHDPRSWRSEEPGSPPILFRRSGHAWVAHLEDHAVAQAATAEALAADVYGDYGVLTVLQPAPLATA